MAANEPVAFQAVDEVYEDERTAGIEDCEQPASCGADGVNDVVRSVHTAYECHSLFAFDEHTFKVAVVLVDTLELYSDKSTVERERHSGVDHAHDRK